MRGERAQGDDALTAEEQALLDADRNNTAPVEAPEPPAEAEHAAVPESAAEGAETAPETAPEPGQPSQQPKMVPHAAMHEERRLRQEAEKRLDEERKRAQTLEERMNIMLRGWQQQQQPQPQPARPEPPALPDLAQDPVAHLKGDIGLVRNELAQRDHVLNALVQAALGQTQQTEQQRNLQMIAARASAAEREFEAQTPDYRQAYEHLVNGRRQELMEAGWTDQAEIDTFMAREAASLAENAFRRGVNPAAVVYNLAKIRGWQPKAPEPTPEVASATQPNTAAAVDQVQMIARGQQQARGVNTIPGQASPPMNATTIANMTEDEFAAWYKKTSPAEQRRVLGA